MALMRRRTLLTAATALPLGAALASWGSRRGGRRGNILMVVVDDLNSWVGCLGGQRGQTTPRAITPAIDQLAARGTLFERAYCPAPYCNASRMAVFSGRWPSSTGVYGDEPFWEQVGRPITYLEALKATGYRMFGAGKVLHGRYAYRQSAGAAEARWLEQENRPFLWDAYATSVPQPLPLDRPLHGIRRTQPGGEPLSPQLDWGVLPAADEAKHPDVSTADAVVRWLEQPQGEPFFCAAGFYSPHLPWYAPQRWFDRYPLEAIQLPLVRADDLKDVPELARQWVTRSEDHTTITAAGQWRQAVQAYLAAMSFADEQVGRVLAALERSPARHNTTVVLWSDNGFHLGEKLHWRKFTLWEEATRVPLIVVPAPALGERSRWRPTVQEPVSVIDLFPTLFALEQLTPPPGGDGVSLLPLMQGQGGGGRPALTSWGAGNHSIRLGEWRYSRYRDGSEELYHHLSDPQEWLNRSGDPSLAEQQQQLRRQLERLVGTEPGITGGQGK